MTRTARQEPEQEIEQLREVIREGHELLKDLKQQEKVVRDTIKDMVRGVIVETITDELEAGRMAVIDAIEKAEDNVYDRFKEIQALALSEVSELSLEDLIVASKVIKAITDTSDITKRQDSDATINFSDTGGMTIHRGKPTKRQRESGNVIEIDVADALAEAESLRARMEAASAIVKTQGVKKAGE